MGHYPSHTPDGHGSKFDFDRSGGDDERAATGVCLDGKEMTELPFKRRVRTKIRPSNACKEDGIHLAVEQW